MGTQPLAWLPRTLAVARCPRVPVTIPSQTDPLREVESKGPRTPGPDRSPGWEMELV